MRLLIGVCKECQTVTALKDGGFPIKIGDGMGRCQHISLWEEGALWPKHPIKCSGGIEFVGVLIPEAT